MLENESKSTNTHKINARTYYAYKKRIWVKRQGRNGNTSLGISPGGAQAGTIYHGVGIVIRNELRNYIVDTESTNERMMFMTLRGRVNYHIVSVYAPHRTKTLRG